VTFDCSLDGAAFAACTSPRLLSLLANGSHTFRVRAKDTAGNIDPTPATTTWTVAVPRTWKILVADNLGKRILIVDFSGHVVWKCSNPLGDTKTFSGPLGVRWLANGHILATFGTGYVAEIDPTKPCPGFPGVATPPTPPEIVWRYNGPASDGFQSPYDAVVLPDGSLAVALRFNQGGKVAVYRRQTGQNLWQLLLGDAHSLEYLPGGAGSSYPAGPTFLMGGHGAVQQVTYDSAKTVVWFYNNGGSFGHRIIEDSDHNIVAAEGYFFHKLRRSDHKELWRIQLVEGTAPNQVQVQWRGVAEDPSTGNYVASDLTDNTIDMIQRNTGQILSHFGVFNIGDGGPYSFMKFPYGLRVIQYP
jgi:DNA-binding beta-propeller fold protein YncE